MDENELVLPEFLDRKVNGYTPDPLPRNVSWKVKNPNKIVWPHKEIERALRLKAREARQARKERQKQEEWNG
jgi:hypothetical protein